MSILEEQGAILYKSILNVWFPMDLELHSSVSSIYAFI